VLHDLFAALLTIAEEERNRLLAAEVEVLDHFSPVTSLGNQSPSSFHYSPPIVPASPLAYEQDIKEEPLGSPVIHASVAIVLSPALASHSTSPSHHTFSNHSASPNYVVRSPSPIYSPTPVQSPPPVLLQLPVEGNHDNLYTNYPHLFAIPTCTAAQDRHPHLYTVVDCNEDQIWCPQVELDNQDFLANILTVQGLNQYSEHFASPFRTHVLHTSKVRPRNFSLPNVTICTKVGKHTHSLAWPFRYLESNFIDSIKFIFNSFLPFWLEHFEGSLVPIVAYDFLDRCSVLLAGYLHFDCEGIFITGRHLRVKDALQTDPYLAQFCADVRVPIQPFLFLSPPPGNVPL
jgi:hypothetical protein